VPLPETIAVKFTEEEAEYLSVRPLVRQTFRSAELVDMILSVTGKDVARIQQILRSGTVVFHFYRYWWQGFESDAKELGALLEKYPDADPSRPFRAEECTAVLLETGGHGARRPLELPREAASAKRLFRTRSFWDCLMDLARPEAGAHPPVAMPAYLEYSYTRQADIFVRSLSATEAAALAQEAERLAPRALRARMKPLPSVSRILFILPREK
jgi:hypothetical protein